MQENGQRIRPRERLDCAIGLLSGAHTVADIGCDHGRLSCAMIQQHAAQTCIAIDISESSLKKADRLIRQIGVEDRVETRLGDGLNPLSAGEADALAILGMGGTLMIRILDVSPPLMGAKTCVLQPMRTAEEIRRWLYERKYPVLDDRVVLDTARYYQVLLIGRPADEQQPLPEGWPEDCFLLGYTAFARREPLMKQLAQRMLATTNRKRKTQRAQALDKQAAQLEQILREWERQP